ncbi:3474_t:CDS:2 [Paraglomus brasilianum]|uniref:3474_t:CDS:1 n=1 Tax=Paraglomus brasilianum TaxID=144538 RepID=A0A9N8ZWZ4_9GLOM|nr:3474_t:CDS:2 [Paraglomus brasilianum]
MIDSQEYEEFAAEYRANNHDAKDGEIILHGNENSKYSVYWHALENYLAAQIKGTITEAAFAQMLLNIERATPPAI